MAICVGLKNDGAFVSADNYILHDANDEPLSVLSVVDKRKIIINNVVYRVMVNLNLKESE